MTPEEEIIQRLEKLEEHTNHNFFHGPYKDKAVDYINKYEKYFLAIATLIVIVSSISVYSGYNFTTQINDNIKEYEQRVEDKITEAVTDKFIQKKISIAVEELSQTTQNKIQNTFNIHLASLITNTKLLISTKLESTKKQIFKEPLRLNNLSYQFNSLVENNMFSITSRYTDVNKKNAMFYLLSGIVDYVNGYRV